MENRFGQLKPKGQRVARLIGCLSTDREGTDYIPGGENFCSAFAPDESRFAWSCGFRKVLIVPWNRYKNCLVADDDKDHSGNIVESEHVSIDCGFHVCSLAFGAGTPEREFPVKREYWTRFDYSKDLTLATGHSNGRVRIWDPYSGKLLLELTDHKPSFPVHSVGFAPDGSLRLASGSEDGTVKIWDLSDDGNMVKTLLEKGKFPVKGLTWSSNARYLCSVGAKQKVFIWDMVDYTLKQRLCGHLNDVVSCSFSPDGAIVATSSNDTRVIVWNVNTGAVLHTFHHMNPPPGVIYMAGFNNYQVKGVSFSPSGCKVASVCSDGYMRQWDVMQPSDILPELVAQGMQDDLMLECTYSPSGGTVAVSYASGCTEFYSVPMEVPTLKHCCRVVIRKNLKSVKDLQGLLPRTVLEYLDYQRWS